MHDHTLLVDALPHTCPVLAHYSAQLWQPPAECCSPMLFPHTTGASTASDGDAAHHGDSASSRSAHQQQHPFWNSQEQRLLIQQMSNLQWQLVQAQEHVEQLQDELEAARVAMSELVAERSEARAEVARMEATANQFSKTVAAAQAAEVQARESEQHAQHATGLCEAQLLAVLSQLEINQQQFNMREQGLQQLVVQLQGERETLKQGSQQELMSLQQQLEQLKCTCQAIKLESGQEVEGLRQQLAQAQAQVRQVAWEQAHQWQQQDDAMEQEKQQLQEERCRSAALEVEVQTATRRLQDFKKQLQAVSTAAHAEVVNMACWSTPTSAVQHNVAAAATAAQYPAAGQHSYLLVGRASRLLWL